MSATEKINDIFSLKRFSLLKELDHDKLLELIDNSSVLNFKKNQSLSSGVKKNQTAFLLSGSVIKNPNSDRAKMIEAGSSLACQAIMTADNRPRIIAGNSASVLCVDAELLDLLINWGGDDGFVVDEINTGDDNTWTDGLLKSEAILSLSPQSIQTLMAVVEPVEVKADQVVFDQGDNPDYYYIVSQGQCTVLRQNEGNKKPTVLAKLGSGDAFGEEALIANSTRSATVKMKSDGLLLRLDQKNFKKLLEQSLVKIVSAEQARKLKIDGAIVIDLGSETLLTEDGGAMEIPLPELRSKMNTLDKKKEYIVVADDNNVCAVGAFLLSRNRFKVYALETSTPELAPESPTKAKVDVAQYEAAISKLQKKLNEVSVRLKEEQDNHLASKQRIQTLEAGLQDTQGSAKKAIFEANALINKSEANLRGRIDVLTNELAQEKKVFQELSADNETLRDSLKYAQNEIELLQGQDESKVSVISEEKNRNIGQLEEKLDALQKAHDGILSEKQVLQHKLDEIDKAYIDKSDELDTAHEQLDMSSARIEDIETELQVLQEQYAVQITDLDQSLEEKQNLTDQIKILETTVEQQLEEMEVLRIQLSGTADHVTGIEHDLQKSQEQLVQVEHSLEKSQKNAKQLAQDLEKSHTQLAQVESNLEQSRQHTKQLEQDFEAQEKLLIDQEDRITTLTEDLYHRSRAAQEQESALKKQIDVTKTEMAEKKATFSRAESDYKQQINQLCTDLKRAESDIKQAAGLLSRQKLRNQVLSEELSRTQYENKRSGVMLKVLLVILFLLIAGIAASYYMGIDLQDKTTDLMEGAPSKIDGFINSIPKKLTFDK